MEQKTPRLYPPAPLENIDSEQKTEKKLNDVKSLKNSYKNIKEMIAQIEVINRKKN